MISKPLQHSLIDTAVGKIKIVRNQNSEDQADSVQRPRVLCLHGWLDNCASFLPMLPYLHRADCVAIDFIGHGQSAHREANALYHYMDYVRDIKLILDALGWEDCNLLGHSMGGAIGLLAVNAYPEKFRSLSLIDIFHPLTRASEDGPAMLGKSLAQFASWDANRVKIFPSLASAVKARRLASPFPQSENSAKLIMQYATQKEKDGYRLLSDARLNFRSPTMLNREQVNAFIQAAKLPVMAILASDGISQRRDNIDEAAALFSNLVLHRLDGMHHVHMDKPDVISELFLGFLTQQNE